VLINKRSNLYYTESGIVTLCGWPSGASGAPVGRGVLSQPAHRTATYRVWWYYMLYNTILTSWWWVKQCSKHVKEYNKHYQARICVLIWLITKITHIHVNFLPPSQWPILSPLIILTLPCDSPCISTHDPFQPPSKWWRDFLLLWQPWLHQCVDPNLCQLSLLQYETSFKKNLLDDW